MVPSCLTPRHLPSSLVMRTVLGLRWGADAPPVPGSTLMSPPETTSRSSRGAQSAVPGFVLAGFHCLAEWPVRQHGVDSFAEAQVREFVQGLPPGLLADRKADQPVQVVLPALIEAPSTRSSILMPFLTLN